MAGLSTFALPIAATTTLLIALRFAVPRGRTRRVRPAVLLRALFPRRIVRSRSGRLDIIAFLFSIFLLGTMIGWAIVSSDWLARSVDAGLVAALGRRGTTAPDWLASAVLTLGVYLAYEFAYWLNHWMSHRFAVLWEFHKVHHSAQSLSALTNYRVHPVDSLLFTNTVAVTTGLVAGAIFFLFGKQPSMWAVGGSNLLVFATAWLLTHLQHSHLWISFPGRLGDWLISPAHHQIHHSTDPAHHNRNFGATLAVWDRLFGTLHKPAATRERLSFGVDDLGYDAHSVAGALAMPFVDAGRHVRRPAVGANPPVEAI